MKKIAAFVFTLVMLFGFVGCSVPPAANSETDLEITLWEMGTGRAFLDNAVAEYKILNPNVNIFINSSAAFNGEEIASGAVYNTVDLYFSCYDVNFNKAVIEPLDSVLDSKVDGNDVAIKDKIDKQYVDFIKNDDGHTYELPWSTCLGGMLYNKTAFKENGFSVPKTTTELIKLAETMNLDYKMTPFIHLPAYWNYLTSVWNAQYDGMEQYINSRSYRYVDESTNIFEHDIRSLKDTSKGRYAVLDVLYELLSPKGNVYTGSNSLPFTTTQTFFLNGMAMMMPCGTWLENEMKDSNPTIEYGLMKAPVMSGMGKRLGISEKQLSAAVSFVDGDTLTSAQKTLVDAIDSAVIDEIRSMRNLFSSTQSGLNAFIPNYAKAKDVAKDFLKFFYSDKGIEIYEDTLHMAFPSKYSDPNRLPDTSKWSTFQLENYELVKTAKSFDFKLNGDGAKLEKVISDLCLLTYKSNPVISFSTTSKTDRRDVEAFWAEENTYWDNNFNRFLKLANLA